MAVVKGVNFRLAEERDIFGLMNLYQIACPTTPRDPVLLNHRLMQDHLRSPNCLWIVAERDDRFLMFLSVQMDLDNRIGKINRIWLDPKLQDSDSVLLTGMPLFIDALKDRIDVVYTTTRTMTLKQQEIAISAGFRILGIFPNLSGADPLKLNVLTAFYLPGVIEERRSASFTLHPMVHSLYEITRRQCDLAPMGVWSGKMPERGNTEPIGGLEVINAPNFVSHRFSRLNEKKSLSTHFYPFHEPNVLITTPEQKVEIFVRVIPELRYAAIIGERLEMAVNPVQLYSELAVLINERLNCSYIEAINDAGDAEGIEYLANSGFLPCAYFPCFKKQGDKRRDYVVLSRSFESLFGTAPQSIDVNETYLAYLTQYCALEEESYLKKLRPPGLVK